MGINQLIETKKMEELYTKIVQKVDEMIPEYWKDVYIYAEIDENYASTIFFYYYSKEEEEYIYSLEIDKIFEIDKKEEEKKENELRKYFKDLKDEFKANNQEVWTNLTMYVREDGEFKIEYDYREIIDAYVEYIIWKYKYLGIEPENNGRRPYKIIENYKKQLELEKENR